MRTRDHDALLLARQQHRMVEGFSSKNDTQKVAPYIRSMHISRRPTSFRPVPFDLKFSCKFTCGLVIVFSRARGRSVVYLLHRFAMVLGTCIIFGDSPWIQRFDWGIVRNVCPTVGKINNLNQFMES